jgi:hypothetical protein
MGHRIIELSHGAIVRDSRPADDRPADDRASPPADRNDNAEAG